MLVVVLVAASTHLAADTERGLVEASESALGPGAVVVVRHEDGSPSDDGARAIATMMHADVVVVVSCGDAACDAVTLHVGGANDPVFHDRVFTFDVVDVVRERGRSLGFGLASMVPLPVKDGVEPPKVVTPPPSIVTTIPERPKDSHPPTRATLHFDLTWMASNGEGSTQGGELNGRSEFSAASSLGLSAALRESQLASVDARVTNARVGAFFGWKQRAGPFDLGFRIDALALHQVLVRHGTGETSGRWVPAADVLFESAFELSSAFAFVGYVGPEVALGSTKVTIGDATVTTLPPLRFLLGLGIRLSI